MVCAAIGCGKEPLTWGRSNTMAMTSAAPASTMTDDDLSPSAARRRNALRILAGAGGLLLGEGSTAQGALSREPSTGCVLTPAQTEGPYFVDERLNRGDIRADPATGVLRPGAPLTLQLRVAAVS